MILNLHKLEKSDIKFKLNRFPDGEVQVTDLEIDKLENGMKVIAPIRNAEELFIFTQLMELIHETIYQVDIVIPYLMGARNDRTMASGRCATLFNVLYIIGSYLFPRDTLTFITVHNEEAVKDWFSGTGRTVNFIHPYPTFETSSLVTVVFPDYGAERRFKHLVKGSYLVAKKSRDVNGENSSILKYEIENPHGIDISKVESVIVIDDLSDGGGTFKLLSSELDKIGKSRKRLYLTHYIQESGLISLSDFYDIIFVCDTFRDVPFQSGLGIKVLKKVEDMI